jgi:hypothetical protein
MNKKWVCEVIPISKVKPQKQTFGGHQPGDARFVSWGLFTVGVVPDLKPSSVFVGEA